VGLTEKCMRHKSGVREKKIHIGVCGPRGLGYPDVIKKQAKFFW